MRINELLTESEMQYLEEGPKLDAFGRGVGKVVGGVAKGVGAVAGGAVGAYNALKKGFQTGKAVVGDDPDPNAGAPGYTAPVEPAARTANTGAADAAPQQAMNAPTSSTTRRRSNWISFRCCGSWSWQSRRRCSQRCRSSSRRSSWCL